MPGQDQAHLQQLQKKKGTQLPAPQAQQSPDLKGPLHQGSAADLQGHVGNAGLNEMISKHSSKDPSQMSPTERAATARADAQQLPGVRIVARLRRRAVEPDVSLVDPDRPRPQQRLGREPRHEPVMPCHGPNGRRQHGRPGARARFGLPSGGLPSGG